MNPVTIDYDLCNKDGICSAVCPRRLFEISEGFPVPVPSIEELCIRCGHCMAVCPTGAISVDGSGSDDCIKIDKKRRATYDQLDHLIKSRRSTRVYKDKPVDRNMVHQILDTCRYSPTGSNAQQVKWIIVDDRDRIRQLGALTIDWMREVIDAEHPFASTLHLSKVVEGWHRGEDRIFRGAPLVLMTHSPETGSLPLESCVIAMAYFDIVAATLGLGTCWVGYFMLAAAHYPPIKDILSLPAGHRIFGTMVAGYPKYSYQRIPVRRETQVEWW